MPKNLALKIAIVESSLSQVDIAIAADLHESRVSQIVNGRREPTDAEQKALARILKRKVADLFPQSKAQLAPATGSAAPRRPAHGGESNARLQSRREETRA